MRYCLKDTERSFVNMAMEDKNTPVQPDAVEATETRGRKVGAARFFELLGRDLPTFRHSQSPLRMM